MLEAPCGRELESGTALPAFGITAACEDGKMKETSKKETLAGKPWFPYTVALCIAVAFYVLLTHLPAVGKALSTVGSYIAPVFLGAVLAYLMNPLFRMFQNRVFRKMRSPKLRKGLSLVLTVLLVFLFLGLLAMTVIPQLISSVTLFAGNLNGYAESLDGLLSKAGLTMPSLDYGEALQKLGSYIEDNAEQILNTTITAGRTVGNLVIGFLLAIYILGEKDMLLAGLKKLMSLLLPSRSLEGLSGFLRRSDDVLVRYLLYSLLESLIVGGINAVFMLIMGMSYAPLVSFVVGVTNLIPTFGPVIGAAIGAFVLVLVKPSHALWFLIFTVVLQILDGYVLKPKLFGNSLGVSGMWILIAIVVGGKMFGVIGMLLAIPVAAILVNAYLQYLIPWLEARKARRKEESLT